MPAKRATFTHVAGREAVEGLRPGKDHPDIETLAREGDLELDALVLFSEPRDIKRKKGARKRKRKKVDIIASVVDASIVRTLEGASSLEVQVSDPDWALMESGLFDLDEDERLDNIDTQVEGHWFRLVKVAPTDDDLTLVFEDREVAWLREYTKPLKQKREPGSTRAEFVQRLVIEPKKDGKRIGFYSPSLHEDQEIEDHEEAKKKKGRKRPRKRHERGLHRGGLTVKGKPMTAEQATHAEIALGVAHRLRAGKVATEALMCAAIGESDITPVVNSLGYGGVFQGQVNTGGHYFTKDDTHGEALYFLKGGKGFQAGGAISLARQGYSPGDIATKVEASGQPGSFYGQHIGEARAIIAAYGSGRLSGKGGSSTRERAYFFRRGLPQSDTKEDSWTAIQRLAREVEWRAFMDRGVLVYISELDLIEQKVAYKLSRRDAMVEKFGFDWDSGKQVAEASLSVAAERWAFGPGVVVEMTDPGPSKGRWLVYEVRRSLFSNEAEVRLRRALPPKPEPAPETETVDRGGKGRDDAGSGPDKVQSLIKRAEVLSRYTPGYEYGGGHGPALDDLKATQGLDCSSSCSLALHRAGLFNDDVAWVSGTFAAQYGKPGRGKYFTVWANAGHVWIQFEKAADTKWWRFDTSQHPGSGPKVVTAPRSTAGFTPRHWPGL